MTTSWIRAVLVVCLVAWMAGCGGGSGGDSSGGGGQAAATPGAATIGAAGGTVSSAEGVRIIVPAGGLADPITLRIARDTTGLNAALAGSTPQPDKAVALSPIFAMTPHATTFAQPVELRIPIDMAAAAGPGTLVALHADPGGAGWDVLPIKAVENGEAVVSISSFSFYKIVKITKLQLLPTVPAAPPKLEMSVTLGGAAPTDFLQNHDTTVYRRLFGTLHTRTETLRLSGHVVGLPAACSQIAFVGRVGPTTVENVAANTVGGGFAFDPYTVFAEVTATPGTDTTGGVSRPTLDFALDINAANAPYKADLYKILRTSNINGPTPPVILSFNAFARCTTPVDMGGGILVQTFKIGPGQLTPSTSVPGASVFDLGNWLWTTILFTAESQYMPQGYISHPDAVSAPVGAAASFSTSAWPVPLGEQRIEWWRSDNEGTSWTRVRTTIVPIEATTDTYTLDPVAQTDHNALFRARLCAVPRTVRQDEICVDGIAARLTVLQGVVAASFSQQPRALLVRSGQTASVSAMVAGAPSPAVRWQSRPANSGGAWADVATGSGAATANYTTAPLALADNGIQLRAVANNLAGDVASVPVTVSVSDIDVAPSIVSQPAALSVVAGSEAVFAVAARGTEALSYQWRRNGIAIGGANAPVLKLSAVTEADATGYSVQVSNGAGSATSDVALLTVSAGAPVAVAPSIVTQPVSVLVNAGNTATFAVGASGSGTLIYQWLRNGQPIVGATAAFYSIAQAVVGDAATYAVQVSNGVAPGVTSFNVVLTVNQSAQPSAVAIGVQPAPQIQAPGGSVTFAVAASGSGPISYQWLKNGAPIGSASTAVLMLTNVSSNDVADYSVSASNSLGSVTSNAAHLTVLGAPLVSTQPAAASVNEGASATFNVTASGNALLYQWTRNNVAIVGATSASYTTPALTPADSGAVYGVIVYNGAGLVLSQGAVLTVTAVVAPSVTQQPGNVTVNAGLPANICAAFGGTPPLALQLARWDGTQWVTVANLSHNSNSLVCVSTPNLQLADNGAQFRFFANNASAFGVMTDVITVTVTPPPTARLALVANSGANTLSILRADSSTGALTSIGTTGAGANPYAVAITPNGLFAVVTNLVGNSVSSYSVNTGSGAVTLVGSSVNSVNPYGIAMDPLGRFTWVANYSASTVSAYSINGSTGQLTAVGVPTASGTLPYAVAAHPSGNYVYVANEFSNSVSAFSVNASTGALTLLAGTVANSVLRPHSIAVDPSGRFVYVTDQGSSVAAFRVNASTGVLSVVGYTNTGTAPTAVAVHPSGLFVYATTSSGVSAFAINSTTGALTAIGSAVAAGSNPVGLALDAPGTHLYVTNQGSNGTSGFSIDATTGALTSLGAAVSTGSGPIGIAITP